MLFDGMTTIQFVAELGVTRQAVSQMDKRNGFPVGGQGTAVYAWSAGSTAICIGS
jgi:hypothetical protein